MIILKNSLDGALVSSVIVKKACMKHTIIGGSKKNTRFWNPFGILFIN